METTTNENTQNVCINNQSTLVVEHVDDIPLLISIMVQAGIPEILDKYIPAHWNQRNLSWGWTAVIWLAYILSTGDHRKISMEEYVRSMSYTLKSVTGFDVDPLDFSDDRLSHLLAHLRKVSIWRSIENELNQRCIEVYELPTDEVNLDATTVSGCHTTTENGLMQFGHSKDDSSLPQFKMMTGSLQPLGMPLATDIVSGEHADDKLYIPIIDRILECLDKKGLLIVADCKMSALEIRAHIVRNGHFYLVPLPLTGNTASLMPEWITVGIEKDKLGELEILLRENEKGEMEQIAKGYEFEREIKVESGDNPLVFTERVIIIRSDNYAYQQICGLDKRLKTAQEKILTLTPPKGKGQRQIVTEEELTADIEKILKEHRVEGLLDVDFERQSEQQTKYVGRGRGSKNRETQIIEKVRYHILGIRRNEDKINEQKQRFGWKAFVSNASKERLSLSAAILTYRNEYRSERIFNRLKSRLGIRPLFVKRDDQIEGLGYLLTLGVRMMTIIEFVMRRSLQKDNAKLPNLHPENKKKETAKPTAERILKAFANITLTIVFDSEGHLLSRHLTTMSALQYEIIERLGLNIDSYQRLIN